MASSHNFPAPTTPKRSIKHTQYLPSPPEERLAMSLDIFPSTMDSTPHVTSNASPVTIIRSTETIYINLENWNKSFDTAFQIKPFDKSSSIALSKWAAIKARAGTQDIADSALADRAIISPVSSRLDLTKRQPSLSPELDTFRGEQEGSSNKWRKMNSTFSFSTDKVSSMLGPALKMSSLIPKPLSEMPLGQGISYSTWSRRNFNADKLLRFMVNYIYAFTSAGDLSTWDDTHSSMNFFLFRQGDRFVPEIGHQKREEHREWVLTPADIIAVQYNSARVLCCVSELCCVSKRGVCSKPDVFVEFGDRTELWNFVASLKFQDHTLQVFEKYCFPVLLTGEWS